MSFADLLDAGASRTNTVASSTGTSRLAPNAVQSSQDGFSVPPISTGSGNGLPSSTVKPNLPAAGGRRLIHWFVPQFGIVQMYVNPESINYNYSKLIQKQATKGGYIIQYWGEELTTLNIRGTTGSSGIEGINVLHEVYRAEQIAFDTIGLTMAASQTQSGIAGLIGDSLFKGKDGGITADLLGNNDVSVSLPKSIPSLAALACGVEMYYQGSVFRGFFEKMGITESKDNIGLFDYTLDFTVTQQRGYRTNFMPWHRSAIDGPSNNGEGGVPMSFAGRIGVAR